MGTLGRLWVRALQEDSEVGLWVGCSRETLGLGTAGRVWGWASGLGIPGGRVGHSRESLGLGTAGVDRARRRVPGEEKS